MAEFQFYPHPDWKIPLVPLNDPALEISQQIYTILSATTKELIGNYNEQLYMIRAAQQWQTKSVKVAFEQAEQIIDAIKTDLGDKEGIYLSSNLEWLTDRMTNRFITS